MGSEVIADKRDSHQRRLQQTREGLGYTEQSLTMTLVSVLGTHY